MKLNLRIFMVFLCTVLSMQARSACAQSYNLLPPTTVQGGWSLVQYATAKANLNNGGQRDGLEVTVVQVDAKNYDASLESPPVQLMDGMTYTLSFVARASIATSLRYTVGVMSGDYHSVGLDTTVALSPAWQKFRATFVASKSSGYRTNLAFAVGFMPAEYWISSVHLVQGAPTELAANTADPGSWTLESDSAGAQGKMIRDGDALKVATIASDGTDWHLQIYQQGIALVEGQNYILSFDIKADNLEDVVLSAATVPLYGNAGLYATIHLAPAWQHISYTFKAKNIKGELSRLPDFNIGAQTGAIWIKNATLVATE